jgi:hypothetical protein
MDLFTFLLIWTATSPRNRFLLALRVVGCGPGVSVGKSRERLVRERLEVDVGRDVELHRSCLEEVADVAIAEPAAFTDVESEDAIADIAAGFFQWFRCPTLATRYYKTKVSECITISTPASQTYIQLFFRPLGQTFADAVANGDAVRKVLRLHDHDTV